MCILLISWNNKWTGDYCSHVCLPLNGPQMSNSHAFIIDRATCWVMNRDGVGAEGKCCASGPQCERRHMREKNGSYSLLKPLRHTKWVTWRTHDVGASYTLDTPVCVHTTSAILLLYLSHTHICVCVWTLMQNKAGCLSFTGCGNRFASMCSLSHEGRGNKERDVALYSREICLP